MSVPCGSALPKISVLLVSLTPLDYRLMGHITMIVMLYLSVLLPKFFLYINLNNSTQRSWLHGWMSSKGCFFSSASFYQWISNENVKSFRDQVLFYLL